MNDEKPKDELNDRFDSAKKSLKKRFDMTKPGVEPIKDKSRGKRRGRSKE